MNKKIFHIKKIVFWFLVFISTTQVLFAYSGVQINLPPVQHLDTEVITNMPITICSKGIGEFSYSLSFFATASNNIEIAFGVDANNDGCLSDIETDLISGWECGEWFILNNKTDFRYSVNQSLVDRQHEFICKIKTFSNGTIKSVDYYDNKEEIFSSLKSNIPVWLFSPKWNIIRLVARGDNIRANEEFFIKVLHQGLFIYFK